MKALEHDGATWLEVNVGIDREKMEGLIFFSLQELDKETLGTALQLAYVYMKDHVLSEEKLKYMATRCLHGCLQDQEVGIDILKLIQEKHSYALEEVKDCLSNLIFIKNKAIAVKSYAFLTQATIPKLGSREEGEEGLKKILKLVLSTKDMSAERVGRDIAYCSIFNKEKVLYDLEAISKLFEVNNKHVKSLKGSEKERVREVFAEMVISVIQFVCVDMKEDRVKRRFDQIEQAELDQIGTNIHNGALLALSEILKGFVI